MEQVSIERMRPEEIGMSAGVVASAMCPNPIHMAVFKWEHEKERDLQIAFFETAIGRMQEVLVAKHEGAIVGVMCYTKWPGCRMPQPQAQQLVQVLQGMFGDRAPGIMQWRAAWGKHDPDQNHWHFGPIGVLPDRQGRGIGTQMLERFCREMDSLKEAAYLETDKAQNLPFYERAGFATVAQDVVLGVPCWFMWRAARE